MGIFTVRSQAASVSAERPLPSLPMATAQRAKSACRTSTVSARRAAPYRGRPLFASRARSSSRRAGPHRAAEHRPHGGPDGLGVVQVRAGVHQEQPVGAEGVRRPQDGPHVPRVLDPVQHHIPAAFQPLRKRPARQAADGEDRPGASGPGRGTSSDPAAPGHSAPPPAAPAGRRGPCTPPCGGLPPTAGPPPAAWGCRRGTPRSPGDRRRRPPASGDGRTADWSGR